jgi:hypothetical protein
LLMEKVRILYKNKSYFRGRNTFVHTRTDRDQIHRNTKSKCVVYCVKLAIYIDDVKVKVKLSP